MDYSELGAYLKEERERQGLSLEDVQQKTKISLSSLEAIEEGRINELPHPVYAKGFIKNYAHYLGLNAEELAGTFAQKAGIDEEFEDETEHLQNELTPARTRGKWTLISILISLLLLAVLGWLMYDLFWDAAKTDTSSQGSISSQSVQAQDGQGAKGQEQSADADDKSSPQDEGWVEEGEVRDTGSRLAENNASALGATPEEDAQDVQQESGEVATNTSSQEQAQIDRDNETNSDAEQEQTPAGTDSGPSEEASQVPAQGKRHALQIEASEACWMSAKIDAKQRDLYLRPGESVTFRFQNVLEIKLGNAGGVQLTFDGQEYPLDAASGDVLSLTFP